MKIDLYIDNNLLDTDQSTVAAINLAIASIENPGQSSVSFTKEIKLPMTARNRKVFTFVEQLQGIELFNNAAHICTITNDEIVVMSGKAILKSINLKAKQYIISIIGNEIDWVEGAQKPISELKSDEGVVYTLEKVEENAMLPPDSAPLIRFIPVDRGAFYNEDGNFTPRTQLVLKDYHPFLNVWGVLSKIFANYKLNCPIEDKLKRLYFPGSVSEPEDIGYIKEENEFVGGVISQTYSIDGDLSNPTSASFLNNITNDDNDKINANGVLSMSKNEAGVDRMYFTPKNDFTAYFNVGIIAVIENTSMVLEMGLVFVGNNKVQYSLLELYSADKLSIKIGSEILVLIINPAKIKGAVRLSPEILGPRAFVSFVFKLNHPEEATEIEIYTPYQQPVSSVRRYRCHPSKYVYIIREMWVIPTGFHDCYIRLKYKNGTYTDILNISDKERDLIGDFYCVGHDIDGSIDLEYVVDIETRTYNLITGLSYELAAKFTGDKGYLASLGVSVGNETTIAPEFGGVAEGENLTLETIGGETPQMDLVQAVKQMYNLMFYTNDQTKELIISPANYFVKDTVVDWRNKIDYAKEIVVQELGEDIGTYLKLNYQEGNDVVKFYNYKTKTTLGQHTVNLENKAKTEGTTLTNQLFMPSITRKVDGVVYAPQLVREKEQQTIEETDFNIDPIIVEVVPNTDMTIPAQYRYPIAAFSEYGAKLSFGTLNSYYSKHTQLYNKGKKITAYLRLTPTDVSNIRYFNESMQDFRAKFLLHINGEDIACELQSIQDYNPRDASTKCEFIYGDYFVQDLEFQVTPADILIGVKAGRFSIQIKSNSEWTIESDSWLTPNITTGLGNATIDVSYTSYSDYKRIGYINVQSTGITKTITITQKQSGPM